ncbi:ATP-binding protein [Lonepinella sp. MS14437]|uniref:ATP-binding protein n=1 Tax=Lonepinella sp. MS14437 TaxID=3003620 RepID=UPI0036D8CA95
MANTFIRTGSGDQRASKEEINALLRDQLFGVMSAKPALKTTLDDINLTTLGRYRDYMARFNPTLPYNTMPEDEFLQRLQIVDGEHLTYGGLLFLGKNIAINRNISDFRVDLLEIPGRSYAEAEPRYTFRLEEQENLWEYYFAIIERLKRYVDMPFKMNELGFAVENSPQLEALREALVNMLMHSDYFSVAKPRVRIFLDRIEFENPGSFPLPIAELLKTDISLPRNPVIAKLFRHVKLAENAGFGFDKMLTWERVTKTKLVFENSIAFSKVTFPLVKNMNVNELGIGAVPPPITPPITELENRLLEVIVVKNGLVTRKEIAQALNIGVDVVKEYMNRLKNKGLLKRVGSNRSGYWIVK